jgi:hypothetical protein
MLPPPLALWSGRPSPQTSHSSKRCSSAHFRSLPHHPCGPLHQLMGIMPIYPIYPHQHDHQERVPPTPPAPPELTAHYQSPRPMRSSQMRLDPSPHSTPCSPIQIQHLLPRSPAFGAGVHFPALFSQPPSTPMATNSPCGWQPSTTPNHAPTKSSSSPESQNLTGTEATTFNLPQGSPSCSLKPKSSATASDT